MVARTKRSAIAVIGAGSWGTALAVQLARAGRPGLLWARDAAAIASLVATRCNERYLPGVAFPPGVDATADLAAAVRASSDVLVVVPSHAFRPTLVAIRDTGESVEGLAWATKGIEADTGLLPHQVAAEVFSHKLPMAVLSGPTFAREVALGLPSAMTIASFSESYARYLAEAITTETFRAYLSTDMIGVEVGGAAKNVYAIGAGISDGLGFGANTRVALITRALAEMTRLGIALGGRRETFMGLAGIGDLVLTSTDDQSRNRRFGLMLAGGASVKQALAEIGQVVEGYFAANAVHQVAVREGVELPIVDQIYQVLHHGLDPRSAVDTLMRRPIMREA
jgi:glycerol-3-phosphate dehydrogenase (NAD(P)+)